MKPLKLSVEKNWGREETKTIEHFLLILIPMVMKLTRRGIYYQVNSETQNIRGQISIGIQLAMAQ